MALVTYFWLLSLEDDYGVKISATTAADGLYPFRTTFWNTVIHVAMLTRNVPSRFSRIHELSVMIKYYFATPLESQITLNAERDADIVGTSWLISTIDGDVHNSRVCNNTVPRNDHILTSIRPGLSLLAGLPHAAL